MLFVTVTLPGPDCDVESGKSAALAIKHRVVLQRDVGQRQGSGAGGAGVKIKSAAPTVSNIDVAPVEAVLDGEVGKAHVALVTTLMSSLNDITLSTLSLKFASAPPWMIVVACPAPTKLTESVISSVPCCPVKLFAILARVSV